MLELPVVRLDPDLDLPAYAKPGDAGVDLRAREDVVLQPGGGRALVATGVAVAIPRGYAGFIQPRSGLALKHGVTCLNTPGTIDSDYRGEVKVILANLGDEDFVINIGDRIAQIIVAPVTQGIMCEVEALDDTDRGTGGFGSTGV